MNIEIKIAQIAYCGLIFLFFGLNSVLEAIDISSTLFALPFYALLGYKIIKTYYTKREWMTGAVLALVSGIVFIRTRNPILLYNTWVLFSMKGIDLKKLLRPLFWSALAGALLVALSSFAGISDISITKDYGRGGVETRYCFGYVHPNACHLYLVRLMCLAVGAYFEKLNWKYLQGMLIFNIFLYQWTVSRTGVACGLLLLVLTAFYLYGKKLINTNVWKWLVVIGFCGGIIFSIAVVFLWGKVPSMEALNRIFTGRISLAERAIRETGFSLFGKLIPEYIICDNGILNALLSYGLIPFGIHTVMYVWLLWVSQKRKEYFVTIALLVLVVYSFTEAIYIEKIFRNIPMMYFTWIMFGGNEKNGLAQGSSEINVQE